MAVKHEETNRTYPRYNWWNEMRRGWTEEEHQFVPLTFGQVEMLQRNRLAFLLETLEGKAPRPFIASPAFDHA
ncbi:MAG: hypothetical protein IJ812_08385 [Schwartzia sp.]|nr:hypothetical protein [Schwartzia sp. (in: firmicutes)]